MTQVQPDTIFKALRLIPDFDGNPNVLTRFIRICDQLVAQYLSTAPGSEFANSCVLNGILNKITGVAANTINANGIPDNWLGICAALINNFSDQRDETALYNDLSLASQGNKTPQEFYEHCQTLFSTIMTYVTLHDVLPTTIEAKRELYKKVTVQAYVRGLKEPLGSRIRCMRPETIEKALEFVQEELNVMDLQQRNEPSKSNSNHSTPKVPPVNLQPAVPQFVPPRLHNVQTPAPNWPVPFGQRPMGHPPQPFKFPDQNQNRPRMPTNTQRMFAAPPPNYNPRSNVFRLPPRNNNPTNGQTPQPMSGVQRFNPRPLPPTNALVGHDWNRFNNQPPNNYFKPREMNVNECTAHDGSYYSDFSNYYEPELSSYDFYYNNYEYSSTYDPALPYDLNSYSYNSTDDYQTYNEPHVQTVTKEEEDFREVLKSSKPK